MKYIIKYLSTLGLFIFVYNGYAQISISQSVIASIGGFVSASNYSISATTGETMITTKTSGSIALTQGFQQALSSSAITAIEQIGIDNISTFIYPNPTSNYISIQITIVETIKH